MWFCEGLVYRSMKWCRGLKPGSKAVVRRGLHQTGGRGWSASWSSAERARCSATSMQIRSTRCWPTYALNELKLSANDVNMFLICYYCKSSIVLCTNKDLLPPPMKSERYCFRSRLFVCLSVCPEDISTTVIASNMRFSGIHITVHG